MSNIVERLRAHVSMRGGLAKDEEGNIVLPNGAWAMMLEAADKLEKAEKLIHFIANDHHELSHDKVMSQRNEYVKLTRKYFEDKNEHD